MNSATWSLEDVRNQVMSITEVEEPYLELFLHGTMRLGMYAPRGNEATITRWSR
jgi:hypothetical protein